MQKLYIFTKEKYRVVFFRKAFETIFVVKTSRMDKTVEILKLQNGKSFIINWNCPAHLVGNTKVYLIDFDSGAQLSYNFVENSLRPAQIDMIVKDSLLKQVISTASIDSKERIINIILGAVIGALCATVICLAIMQSKIAEIYESSGINPITIG